MAVFDERGSVVSFASHPLRRYDTPRPGIAEHPGDDLWMSVGEASRKAMAAFAGDIGEIAAVGLCTIRFCRALLKSDGTLASPVMSWMDARVGRPYEDDDPSVSYVTTSSGYIAHRMTAEFRDTAANYQGAWPIDADTWAWRTDPGFSDFGIRREQLFDLVMPGDPLGQLTAEAARHTGLPVDVPVVATANDKAVEALGAGLRSTDDLLASLGTYVATMITGEKNIPGSSAFWTNFASAPRRYLYESTGIRRGMWTVSWWAELLGEEVSEQYLDAGAELIPAGSDGLMVVLDWLAPTDQSWRRGSILGFDVRHGRFHVHRAILEGVAMTLLRCASEMVEELGRHYDRLLVSGGGSASELMMRIMADAFGTASTRARVRSSVALGAAICAAVGVGLHPSFEAGAERMVSFEPPIAPDPARHEIYQKLSPIYDRITPLTDTLYSDLQRELG